MIFSSTASKFHEKFKYQSDFTRNLNGACSKREKRSEFVI